MQTILKASCCGTQRTRGGSLCLARRGRLAAHPLLGGDSSALRYPCSAASSCSALQATREAVRGDAVASSLSCINKLRMNHLFLNYLKQSEGQKHSPCLRMKLFFTFFSSTCSSNCPQCYRQSKGLHWYLWLRKARSRMSLSADRCGSGQRESCGALFCWIHAGRITLSDVRC